MVSPRSPTSDFTPLLGCAAGLWGSAWPQLNPCTHPQHPFPARQPAPLLCRLHIPEAWEASRLHLFPHPIPPTVSCLPSILPACLPHQLPSSSHHPLPPGLGTGLFPLSARQSDRKSCRTEPCRSLTASRSPNSAHDRVRYRLSHGSGKLPPEGSAPLLAPHQACAPGRAPSRPRGAPRCSEHLPLPGTSLVLVFLTALGLTVALPQRCSAAARRGRGGEEGGALRARGVRRLSFWNNSPARRAASGSAGARPDGQARWEGLGTDCSLPRGSQRSQLRSAAQPRGAGPGEGLRLPRPLERAVAGRLGACASLAFRAHCRVRSPIRLRPIGTMAGQREQSVPQAANRRAERAGGPPPSGSRPRPRASQRLARLRARAAAGFRGAGPRGRGPRSAGRAGLSFASGQGGCFASPTVGVLDVALSASLFPPGVRSSPCSVVVIKCRNSPALC